MSKICFLSMDDMGSYVADDHLAIEPLSKLGIEVETLSWRQTVVSWGDFDAVIIRTPWDYQRSPQEFLQVLKQIESETRLANSSAIAKWNFDKRYLSELENLGVAIVPTLWNEAFNAESFEQWKHALDADELIVKPVVSATAMHTYRLIIFDPSLVEVFSKRDFMVQPFVPAIVNEGEYSLFYFNGVYSHSILKAPKSDDFRVQEEHGGIITATEPCAKMVLAAESILTKVREKLLYARVDLVRHNDNFALMELELIEPALYLRMDADAPSRFAVAIRNWLAAN